MSSQKLNRFLIQITPLVFFLAIMISQSNKAPMWMDEYVFYRLSSNLPNYSTNSSWFFKDRPAMLTPTVKWAADLDREEAFKIVYDTPIYTHTPLPTMLVWPIVKPLNALADAEVLPHIEEEDGYTPDALIDPVNLEAELMTKILRILPMLLFTFTMWLIFRLLLHKVGNNAYLFPLPIAAGVMMLIGAYLFYWDIFMMFFFVLTLFLMETRPNSKWKYVTACLLVNTKLFIGILFLIPLVVKAYFQDKKNSWKMALPALAIIPFYITTVVVTGNPLYVITHYLNQMPIHDFIYTLWVWPDCLNTLFNLGVPFYLIMTLPLLWFWKKYPEYVTFWVITMVYAWGTGLGITHTASMLYAGALCWPIVAYEFNIMEKLQKWLNPKKVEA